MIPRIPNPDWPSEIQVLFTKIQSETSLGCGGCAHAEWRGYKTYVKSSDSEEAAFDVSLCRSGIPIQNGEPLHFCTAAQRTISTSSQTSDVPNKPGFPPSTMLTQLRPLAANVRQS
jgi:hypothetical protein